MGLAVRNRGFIDKVRVLAIAGKGGDGCASFFRDTRVERGPPEGGSGGIGGSVLARATSNQNDLRMSHTTHTAESGGRGHGSGIDGRNGPAKVILVPRGTTVHRVGEISYTRISAMQQPSAGLTYITELLEEGDECILANGGRAGRGNAALRSGRIQSSRLAEDGHFGEMATYLLRMKSIADVGLVGFPNAGKSSILSVISQATPRIAAYPFTTLHPQLGIVQADKFDAFSVADIPGLIEGASENRGLGHEFLAHIERTLVLCYVLDLSGADHPIQQLDALRRELDLYQSGLSQRACVIVANKGDTEDASNRLRELREEVVIRDARGELPGLVTPPQGLSRVTAISARDRMNLPALVCRLHAALKTQQTQETKELDRMVTEPLPGAEDDEYE